jgi:hypothetical protein
MATVLGFCENFRLPPGYFFGRERHSAATKYRKKNAPRTKKATGILLMTRSAARQRVDLASTLTPLV